jgi:hypothetical protein
MVATTPAAVLRLTGGGYEEAIQLAVRAAGDAAAAAGWLPAPTFSADHAFATDLGDGSACLGCRGRRWRL